MNEINENTAVDYGPLTLLIGDWQGDKGLDVAPEPGGREENPYFESLSFSAIGNAVNAGTQKLAVLRYHQVVSRKVDGEIFHDETGYWMWDASNATVMHSLAIPRAVCVLAGGPWATQEDAGDRVSLLVAAKLDDPDWGIVQSPFMRDHARTLEFRHEIVVERDRLTYREMTLLDIYGKTFEHTDANELTKVQ